MQKRYAAFGLISLLSVSCAVGMKSTRVSPRYENKAINILGQLFKARPAECLSGWSNSDVDSDDKGNDLQIGYTVQCRESGCFAELPGWHPGTIRTDLERHRAIHHDLCSIKGHRHKSKIEAKRCLARMKQKYSRRNFKKKTNKDIIIDVLEDCVIWRVTRRRRGERWQVVEKIGQVKYKEIVR